MYQKLAGMTGTAATEAEEFEKIYGLETVVVPTNLPMIRVNHPDLVYKTMRAKYAAVVGEIEECYQKGQPVLVGTTSIERNEIIAKFLTKKGVPHNVLNAKHHEKEAGIIAEAGKKKGVTVATNMAGRGVDIVLGGSKPEKPTKKESAQWQKEHDEIIKLGGLHVIGTERHESRRIDNQLRGRSGRQGDPGSSRFFVGLDDDIMRLFGGEQVAKIMTAMKLPEDQPIEHAMVSKAIEQAQVKVEGFNFDLRKRVVDYDDVMNKQREIIYQKRSQLLEAAEKKDGELKTEILNKMAADVSNLVAMYAPEGFEKIEYDQITASFCEILPFDSNSQGRLKAQLKKLNNPEKITTFLTKMLTDAYEAREKQATPEVMRQLERLVYLRTVDRLWIDHLDAIDDLREGIGLRGYAQQDPLVEYKKEAFASFERLMDSIDHEVVRRIFRVQVAQQPQPRVMVQTQEQRGTTPTPPIEEPAQSLPVAKRAGVIPAPGIRPGVSAVPADRQGRKKIGRNDPCPCGSDKKYKKCCYPKYG